MKRPYRKPPAKPDTPKLLEQMKRLYSPLQPKPITQDNSEDNPVIVTKIGEAHEH